MDLTSMTPEQRAAYLRRTEQIAQLPAAVRAQIADEVINSQRAVKQVIYRSRVRFEAGAAGDIPAGTAPVAFGYKIGDALAAAGYAVGQATAAHTNLRSAGGQTNRNADVVIWSMGIEIMPGSNAELVKELVRSVYLGLSLTGGSDTDLIGQITDFPGGGGLKGRQWDPLAAVPADVECMNNGEPLAGNVMQFTKPYRWNAASSKKPDSNLSISFTVGEAIALGAGYRAAYADFKVKLLTVEVSDRSSNQ